ncbi:MAG: gas vesicle protein GvpO [Bacillota bacterium]|nr:gas vesicle protein GvpO [Bacillota bacterium]
MGVSAEAIAKTAARKVSQLTEKPAKVVGVIRENDSWKVTLELVEKKSIPDSMDVLATYEVQISSEGEMLGFSRGRLRKRGDAREGDT